MTAGQACIEIIVQSEDFDVGDLYAAMRARRGAELGAVACFVGLVRDRNKKAGSGEEVSALTLEHYPGMTEKSMRRIAERVADRWPVQDLVVVHRVGTLQPADQIVTVLCGSAHRDAAFAAAESLMDYLKTDAVFWKREQSEQGSKWIESTADDRQRARRWE